MVEVGLVPEILRFFLTADLRAEMPRISNFLPLRGLPEVGFGHLGGPKLESAGNVSGQKGQFAPFEPRIIVSKTDLRDHFSTYPHKVGLNEK